MGGGSGVGGSDPNYHEPFFIRHFYVIFTSAYTLIVAGIVGWALLAR